MLLVGVEYACTLHVYQKIERSREEWNYIHLSLWNVRAHNALITKYIVLYIKFVGRNCMCTIHAHFRMPCDFIGSLMHKQNSIHHAMVPDPPLNL